MGISMNRTEIVFVNTFVKNHQLEMIVKVKKFPSYFFKQHVALFFSPCPQNTLSLLDSEDKKTRHWLAVICISV